MRDKAGVTSETRSECEGLMKAKVAALKGKAKEEAGC
jgi:hypothetical protein